MERKTVIVTGGSRGLGRLVAESLAGPEFEVVITSRDQAKGEVVAEEIRRASPEGATIHAMALDLASLAAVRKFTDAFMDRFSRLHVLLNNAGLMHEDRDRHLTKDGFEDTLQANTLGPFLLTARLLPILERSAPARIVNVSSRLHIPGSYGASVDFRFDDVHLANGYNRERAYKNSKLALMWLTYELARRIPPSNIAVNAVCPGFVPATQVESTHGLARFLNHYVLPLLPSATTPKAAAESILKIVTDRALDGTTGKFFGEGHEIPSSEESHDVEKAGRFWDLACEMVVFDRGLGEGGTR
jgi:NAD(P)-dependent dehydrogenase (short-subunit alcohol dehydrogenase family)